MSLSSTALEQREKEEKALRTFLWLCVISSVVLHGVALAVGVIVPWNRVFAPKEEPVEVTMVEPLPQEVPKLKEEQPAPPSPQPRVPLKPESAKAPTPEKVEERQPRPTETRPVEPKAVNPSVSAPTNQATQTDQPLNTAGGSQASPEGLTNPFKGLLGSRAGDWGQEGGGGTETQTGTGIDSGAAGSGQGTDDGTGTGAGQGSGTGSGTGTGVSFGTGAGQGSGTGSRTGTGAGQGSRTGTGSGSEMPRSGRSSANTSIDDKVSLEGLRVEGVTYTKDGKANFNSTGDPELDKQIRRQLEKTKKKSRQLANAKGPVDITFGKSRKLKQSDQVRNYLERQARERRGQTTTRQSGDSTTSSVIQRGVDVPAATRIRSRISPSSTSTPVRRTRVRRTESTSTPTRSRRSTATSEQSTPSTSTPVRRTRVKVRKIQSTSTPTNSAPASESE